ncbi:MAG: glycogen/starch synthase [bacterium]|nr:glycogen/starch synthase [bacterium]
MRVLFAAAECSPLARTGGLGEAVAGLARALRRGGIDVTVVIPRYRHLAGLGIEQGGTSPARAVRRVESGDLQVLMVDDPKSFDRPGIYGPDAGSGNDDQWMRFGRFSVAVRNLAVEYDLLHLHDAHTAPAALTARVPTVFTIHNALYPILGPLDEAAQLLGANAQDVAPGGALEWYGQAHFLKAGVAGASAVTTVSPTFARELGGDPSLSGGLDGVVNALERPLTGILNGIDTGSWDPASDPALPAPFSVSRPEGRETARRAVMERSGLAEGRMLLGMVTRLADQKGIALLEPSIDALVEEGYRLVVVGNGDLDGMVDGWATRHPEHVWHAPYTEELARLVSAGIDAFLMPSRFEPCGLGQMYAMRYGAVPVVRLTGGLADTVRDLDEDPERATGFGFRSFTPESLLKTIRRAGRIFTHHPNEWQRLQRNAMSTDFSWDRAALHYLALYRSVAIPRTHQSEV